MDFNIDPDPRSPEAQQARSNAHRLLASRLGAHPSFAFKGERDKAVEEAFYLVDALAVIAHVLVIAVTDEKTGPLILDKFKNDPQALLNFVDSLVDKRIDDAADAT